MSKNTQDEIQYLTKSNKIIEIKRPGSGRLDATLVTLDGERIAYVRNIIFGDFPSISIAVSKESNDNLVSALKEAGFKVSISYF